MKKVLALVLVCCMLVSLAACSKKTENQPSNNTATNTSTPEKKSDETPVAPVISEKSVDELSGGQLKNGKFENPVAITVEVYDRSGAVAADNNMYTDYIKKGVKEKYNIDVTYVPVSRWEEVNIINNLLAGSEAPDLCVTYEYSTIQAYQDMGGIVDLAEWTDPEKAKLFPHLWDTLGSAGMLFRKDKETGFVPCIEGVRVAIYKSNTFIRADWLEKLNLKMPTTTEEFEKCLIAFKDNAKTLLGEDADKMVPFTISTDVGWRAGTLLEAQMPVDITDKDLYVTGFDDRHYLDSTTKETIRLLNKWYNAGLVWKDFALYDDETFEDDQMKAGYVGAFIHNYDYPFRGGKDNFNASLANMVGEGARFEACNPFNSTDGSHTQYWYAPASTDRKIFMPATCKNPLACMLYLDWISDPENVQFLQMGVEGITHTVANDGTLVKCDPDADHVDYTIVSLYNIDYTMTINGLCFADKEATLNAMAWSYEMNDPKIVRAAIDCASVDARIPKVFNLGTVAAESGLGNALKDVRNANYCKSIVCAPAEFDKVWDDGMKEYLAAGGQAIMDERKEKWEAAYGSAVNVD